MPVPGIIGRRNQKRRPPRGSIKNVARPTPIGIVSTTIAGDTVTIVFNQPVQLNGIPQFLKSGAAPTAATLSAPNTLVLSYTSGGPITNSIVVPAEDPSVRNSSGGYVTPTNVAA